MNQTTSITERRLDEPARSPRRRRRTLGLCAHCHAPVDVDSESVRLYRLAWHVDCALAAAGPAAELAAPD